VQRGDEGQDEGEIYCCSCNLCRIIIRVSITPSRDGCLRAFLVLVLSPSMRAPKGGEKHDSLATHFELRAGDRGEGHAWNAVRLAGFRA
jgi:hypothetical protein